MTRGRVETYPPAHLKLSYQFARCLQGQTAFTLLERCTPVEIFSLSVHSQISIRSGETGGKELEEEYSFQILDSVSSISSVCCHPTAIQKS